MLGQQDEGRVPLEIGLLDLEQETCHALALTGVDVGAGGGGCTIGETGELELGAALFGGAGDQVARPFRHFGLRRVGQHFQAVADGTDGIDQVVADAAAQHGGEVGSLELDDVGHRQHLQNQFDQTLETRLADLDSNFLPGSQLIDRLRDSSGQRLSARAAAASGAIRKASRLAAEKNR